MKETDLFEPIRNMLETMGYHIKAEIKNVDVFGVKEQKTIAVEMKLSINLKLIYQAVDRQVAVDDVYIAVPINALRAHKGQMKYLNLLLKKLNIGLIVIDQGVASIYYERDQINGPEKKNKKTKKLLSEFNQRENHQNVGGTKDKKITAYKEKTIRIAHMLHKMKSASPKDLKAHTGIDLTSSILQKNYEGWFEKVERGKYQLSIKGQEELKQYLILLDLN